MFSCSNFLCSLGMILIFLNIRISVAGVSVQNLPPSPAPGILDVLDHYETLHASSIHHNIEKRGTRGKADHIKELKFKALGRLYLQPTVGLLSQHFKAFAVDGRGKKQPVYVDPENFYSGHVFGERLSSVQAHLDDTSLLTATISTTDDSYYIEPMWRHDTLAENGTMIMYRGSDVRNQYSDQNKTLESFCGYVRPPSGGHVIDDEDDSDYNDVESNHAHEIHLNGAKHKHGRIKRQADEGEKNRCSLLLVADHKFHGEMGQGSVHNTINYLINLIQVVNQIYQHTEWEGGITNMSFIIKEMLVHTEAQQNLKLRELHYNMETPTSWNVEDLLRHFSKGTYRSYCLAHLFTHQKFDGGVLGLAYVGSPRRGSVGGICTQAYYDDETLWLNTGLSSSMNFAGSKVIAKEANIVTAHELGHNWGSEHDPATEECNPPAPNGSYIMYTYSVSGYYANNFLFSPCSKRSVGAVLQAKAARCFSESTDAFCGNYQVEPGEECDAGLIGSGAEDPCCTHNCKLKPDVECSDQNSACCKNCYLAPSGQVCRNASHLDAICESDSMCTGFSAECPTPGVVENGTSCLDGGQCWGGICLPFCEIPEIGKKSCICDGVDGCKRCCRENETSVCNKYVDAKDPDGILVRPGQPCNQGTCNVEGVCEKTTPDPIQRFWDIIVKLDIDYITVFIHDNIVGTVLILSLIVWIPASCVINYVDNKRKKKSEEEESWRKPDNSTLIRGSENERIRNFGNQTVRSLRNRPTPRSAGTNQILPFSNIIEEPPPDYN